MSKYEVGDRFIVEVTKIDSGGMGTVIYLDEAIMVTEKQLDGLEVYAYTPLSKETEEKEPKKDTYTLEDLQERIMKLNMLLGDFVKKYKDLKAQTEEACVILDNEIK